MFLVSKGMQVGGLHPIDMKGGSVLFVCLFVCHAQGRAGGLVGRQLCRV